MVRYAGIGLASVERLQSTTSGTNLPAKDAKAVGVSMSVTGISTAKPTSMKIWLVGLEAAACDVKCGGIISG